MNQELVFGASKTFRNTVQEIDTYSKSHWPILITGETGVGKELLARRVHCQSLRSKGPFVPVNCGALPAGLFESELFGFERGAFSGAVQSHRGLIRQAQGGSLFLDEIGELDLNLQVKLLRLLELNEIRSVGSTRVEYVDVRVIAATNRPLDERIREGLFRHDLFERLCVLSIEVPPLRERKEDIPLLAKSILERLGTQSKIDDFSCLLSYDWPGNARQLRNLLIRASVLGGSGVNLELLETLVSREKEKHFSSELADSSLEGVTLAELEKQAVIERLKKWHGNRKKTAKDLGIAKSTLHEKLKKWKWEGASESWPLYREPQLPSLG